MDVIEVSVPDYIVSRLQVLRAERLRLEGRIAELEALEQAVVVRPIEDKPSGELVT